MPSNEKKRNRRKSIQSSKCKNKDEDLQIETNFQALPVRLGSGRVKKTKIPFDPSDSNVPRRRPTICDVRRGDGDELFREPTAATIAANTGHHKRKTSSGSTTPTVNSKNKIAPKAPPCVICEKYEKPSDRFIICKDCPAQVHLTCLRADSQYFSKSEEFNWYCESCETCVVCYETSIMAPLLKCVVCSSSYHMNCHDFSGTSKLSIVNKRRFRCRQCVLFDETMKLQKQPISAMECVGDNSNNLLTDSSIKRKSMDSVPSSLSISAKRSSATKQLRRPGFAGFSDIEIKKTDQMFLQAMGIDNTNGLGMNQQPATSSAASVRTSISSTTSSSIAVSSSSKSITTPQCHQELENNGHYEETWSPFLSTSSVKNSMDIPKADDWSADDVYSYFMQFFPKDASVFRDHKIDGASLLLMKRQDILKQLNLKLGIALKIYSHVVRLQAQSNDPRLSW